MSLGRESFSDSPKSIPTLTLRIPTCLDWPDHKNRPLSQDWANALVHRVLTTLKNGTDLGELDQDDADACPKATKLMCEVVDDFSKNLTTEILKGPCPDEEWKGVQGYYMPDELKDYALDIDTDEGGHNYEPMRAMNSTDPKLFGLGTELRSNDKNIKPHFDMKWANRFFSVESDPVSGTAKLELIPSVCLENGSHRALPRSAWMELKEYVNAELVRDRELASHPDWAKIAIQASEWPEHHLPKDLGKLLLSKASEWLERHNITCDDLTYAPHAPRYAHDDVVLTTPTLDTLCQLSSDERLLKAHFCLNESLKQDLRCKSDRITALVDPDLAKGMDESLDAIRAAAGGGADRPQRGRL